MLELTQTAESSQTCPDGWAGEDATAALDSISKLSKAASLSFQLSSSPSSTLGGNAAASTYSQTSARNPNPRSSNKPYFDIFHSFRRALDALEQHPVDLRRDDAVLGSNQASRVKACILEARNVARGYRQLLYDLGVEKRLGSSRRKLLDLLYIRHQIANATRRVDTLVPKGS